MLKFVRVLSNRSDVGKLNDFVIIWMIPILKTKSSKWGNNIEHEASYEVDSRELEVWKADQTTRT